MKYGLVMEGGAMRGLFTAGVTDVLMENGITFDGAVGVSAGAAFGCNYKSGQHGRTIRYNWAYCRDKRYCSIRSLIKTGDMFGADFCYHELPGKLDVFDTAAFRQSPMEFYVVATDVLTGKPVYKKLEKADYNELEWIRASASLPLAARVVEVDGCKLMDGGISDSIPLNFFRKAGYERNVVILTRPRDYIKKQSRSMLLMSIALRKYPKLLEAVKNRPHMYNAELKYVRSEEKKGTAFVIAPDEPLPVGHIEHNSEVLLEVYRRGRAAANNSLSKLMKFLGK